MLRGFFFASGCAHEWCFVSFFLFSFGLHICMVCLFCLYGIVVCDSIQAGRLMMELVDGLDSFLF